MHYVNLVDFFVGGFELKGLVAGNDVIVKENSGKSKLDPALNLTNG